MGERALVLGGGGVTGVAWELGLIAGLTEAGLNLADADLVVGTSAGSVVGADITSGHDLDDLYQRQLAPPVGEIAARMGRGVLARLGWIMLTSRNPDRARRRIGRLARSAKTESEVARRKVIEARLPTREWPAVNLRVTAVDAQSGEFTVFDAASGVGLVDAVGASCAVPGVWPPVSIGGRRYVDGGMRSAANADLADGYRKVVIIAPIVQGFGHMTGPATQAAALTSAGASVVLIKPDAAAIKAIGKNLLDPARRAAAARAGRAQAAAVLDQVAAVWQPDDAAPGADRAAPAADDAVPGSATEVPG
jgi:NTE family protein